MRIGLDVAVLKLFRPQKSATLNLSASGTVQKLCGRDRKISKTVARRCLLNWGLKGRVAAKKPLLRRQNIVKRLAFAKEHVHWSNDQWAKVLFSDKSKFEIFGNKRRLFVRRFEGERFKKYCLQPTVKHGGGSVMVWGATSVHGSVPLKKIEGIMDMKVNYCYLFSQ